MGIVKRQPDDRREKRTAEFPLTDKRGNRVIHDRRTHVERRHSVATQEELLILFLSCHRLIPTTIPLIAPIWPNNFLIANRFKELWKTRVTSPRTACR